MIEIPLLNDERPVQELSDAEVIIVSEMMMPDDLHEEFSELLAMNREGELDEKGQQRLDEFTDLYGKGLLRKSQGLVEAVKRGLREPLSF
jgi:hypothetical protein